MQSLTQELVERAVAGEAAALRQVIDALSGPFHALALRMLGNHADAEDATQEALLRVTTRLSSYDGRAMPSTWAWRVAVRCILDQKRGARHLPLLSFDVFAADLADGIDDSAPRPDDALRLQQLKVGCGRALLQCLDGDHRVAYVLGEILELPGPEAAEILEITPATYRKRLSRSRTRVREALGKHCGVVNPEAGCQCHRRLERAENLDRLAPQDREGAVDFEQLDELVRSLPTLDRAAAYYRADPRPGPGAALLARVHRALGI